MSERFREPADAETADKTEFDIVSFGLLYSVLESVKPGSGFMNPSYDEGVLTAELEPEDTSDDYEDGDDPSQNHLPYYEKVSVAAYPVGATPVENELLALIQMKQEPEWLADYESEFIEDFRIYGTKNGYAVKVQRLVIDSLGNRLKLEKSRPASVEQISMLNEIILSYSPKDIEH